MCKIILKFGDPLTSAEIADHREHVEKGAGLIWKSGDSLRITRNMIHSKVIESYHANVSKSSPFHLFHSRFPSEGSVNFTNIQPFISEDFAFCHNGTVMDMKALYLSCIAQRVKFTDQDSDSLLLFKLIKSVPPESAVAFIKSIDQNFIMVFRKRREIHIIGRYEIETDEKEERVLMAKNAWGRTAMHVVTDFDGKIKYSEVTSRYAPTQLRFRTVTEIEEGGK